MEVDLKDFKEIADKISTPGDISAVSLGGGLGLAVDLLFLPAGVPPGTVAAASALTVFGLKKVADIWRNSIRAKEEAERREAIIEQEQYEYRHALRGKVDEFKKTLSKDKSPLLQRFEKYTRLWDASVLDDEKFETALNAMIEQYLESDMSPQITGTKAGPAAVIEPDME